MARSDATAFLIEVLEGPAAGAALQLEGRELPYRSGAGGSISYGRELRTVTTWYPGARAATQQILGPTLLPTTISGVWREHLIGLDRPITLAELFEELLQQGAQVRVSWSTIVRTGVIKRVVWKPGEPVGGLGDLGYEIAFEWVAADDRSPITAGEGERGFRDRTIQCMDLLGNLGVSVESLTRNLGTALGATRGLFAATRRQLESLTAELRAPFDGLVQVAVQSSSGSELPAHQAIATVTAASGGISVAGRISTTAEAAFPASTAEDDSLEQVLSDALARLDLSAQAHEAVLTLWDLLVEAEAETRPDTYLTLPAVHGSDLRRVALRFYGDADLWPLLARANGFEGSRVPEEVTTLRIPESLPAALDQGLGC